MQQVIDHLRSEGFPINDFVPDGKIHRFPMDDKDKTQSGWYLGYQNFLQSNGESYFSVSYGSWKYDTKKKYCTLKGKLPVSQAKLHKDQWEKANREADEQRQKAYEQAAGECGEFWNNLELTGASPYLTRKKIAGHDLGIRFMELNACLYVPTRDIDGKLWSVEEINAEGKKLSWTGGRKAFGFHLIGEVKEVIYLAEGFATAASIHLATGQASVCTFGTGQFRNIAGIFKKKYADKRIVICGDLNKSDRKSQSEKLAEEAGKSIICPVIFPSFVTSIDDPTDFNDLHCREGLEEVKRQLEASTAIEPIQLSGPEIFDTEFPDEIKGRRLGTIENVKELLRRQKNTKVRYNGMSKEIEFLIPGFETSLDNHVNSCFAKILSWCQKAQIPYSNLSHYLLAIADENLYNPVQTWIESQAWDGVSRLKEFFDTLEAPEMKIHLKETLIKKWLFSAVAAAYLPTGVCAHGVLVLQGEQYLGKTEWFKTLMPEDFLGIGLSLNPDNKDSKSTALSKHLVELGELDGTFSKTEIAKLKAFFTNNRDSFRRPFAKSDSHYPRRTVFFGSVNPQKFLVDTSGNRRFWTIPCKRINTRHGIDMQQLWAELAVLYKEANADRSLWMLTREELEELNRHNEGFESVDPIEELIEDCYGWELPHDDVVHQWKSATEVAREIGVKDLNKQHTNNIARILKKKKAESNSRRKYWIPSRKQKAEDERIHSSTHYR